VNWEFLVDSGTISRKDLNLFNICDTVEEAYQYLTQQITKNQLKGPNF